MSVRQLWEGTDAAGWAQKLNGRTKLLFLFLFAILMIIYVSKCCKNYQHEC